MPPKTQKILMFLAEGFEDLEAASILDVCGWTEYRDHIPHIDVVTTGFHSEIHGRFGLVVKPDLPFASVKATSYAALALPGGFRDRGFDEVYDPRLYELARAIHAQGGTIATMCVGILPIAKAGMLKGKRATSYAFSRHDNLARLRALGAIVVNEPVVVDDRIISCAGPAQAMDVALRLLENVVGREATAEVRRYLGGAEASQ